MNKAEEYRSQIEAYLASCFAGDNALTQAMRYGLLSGGKRIRPILCLEFSRLCGGSTEKTLPVACGIEMLHCYSLIHDDLPCMDNDIERRGKPSCHVVFGETVATLAGDCLQAEAFAAVCSADIPDSARAKCCALLARAAGAEGICGGQLLDLTQQGGEDYLLKTDSLKTAALIAAACAMGAAAAGAAEETVTAAENFGFQLGMAFQLRDDMLDGDGFAALLGPEECARRTAAYTQKALEELNRFENADFLREMTEKLADRFT